MKWYFASRTRHQQKLIELSELLKARGEDIASDWVYVESLLPLEHNLKRVQEVGAHNLEMIRAADVFVLISDPEGTDMFVELGAAFANGTRTRVYIVGPHARRSLMQLHASVTHANTLKEVLEKEGIDCEEAAIPSFD